MEKKNIYTEAARPERKTGIFRADDFAVDLLTYDPEVSGRLHICGKEEFFYIIKGDVEMKVENEILHLKEGDAIMIKVGEKHKHKMLPGSSMLIVTKRPHSHKFFK